MFSIMFAFYIPLPLILNINHTACRKNHMVAHHKHHNLRRKKSIQPSQLCHRYHTCHHPAAALAGHFTTKYPVSSTTSPVFTSKHRLPVQNHRTSTNSQQLTANNQQISCHLPHKHTLAPGSPSIRKLLISTSRRNKVKLRYIHRIDNRKTTHDSNSNTDR